MTFIQSNSPLKGDLLTLGHGLNVTLTLLRVYVLRLRILTFKRFAFQGLNK